MAEKFTQHTGLVVPLDAANVDTDAIIPKQFLQKVTRTGFGAHLFNDWRFLDDKGEQPNPEFVLSLYSAGARKLRLRFVTRTRTVGADRLRF